jgi:flagellar hook-associated protein 1
LNQAREAAHLEAKDTVDEINAIVAELAKLNQQIVDHFGEGTQGEALIDQRNQLLNQLSEKVGISVLPVDENSVSVFLKGGPALLSSTIPNKLKITGGGNAALGVEIVSPSGSSTKTTIPLSGRLGGLFQARDVTGKQVLDDLDQMAFGMVTAVNTLHQAGFGLDGSTGNNFFDPLATATGAAQGIAVSALIENNPDKIAAAKVDTLLPNDNSNMLD